MSSRQSQFSLTRAVSGYVRRTTTGDRRSIEPVSNNEVATEKQTREVACPDPFYVLGLDVGGTKTVAALADSAGSLLAEIDAPTVRYSGQSDYPDLYTRLRDQLVQRAGVEAGLIRAAGVSVAGIIEPRTERLIMAPNLSPGGFDLRSIVEGALGIPTAIENDVNLAAVGEHRCGVAQGCEHFIFVAIGTGIGAGIFMNGHLYRGAHNAAGEVGYLYVRGVESIGPDGLGALEKRAAGPGIAQLARDHLLSAGRDSSLSKLDPHLIRSEAVWAAALEGDVLAAGVISETVETIALGLANMAFILDPEMIILGGGVSRVGDALLLPLRERLSALLTHPVCPRLELSRLGSRAQLYGAVYQALDLIADPGKETHLRD